MPRKRAKDMIEREAPKGPDAYALWGRRLERARRIRRDPSSFNSDAKMQRALRLFRGKHWSLTGDDADVSSDSPRDRITVNLTRAHVKDFVAFLVNKNPQFNGKPRVADKVAQVRRKLALQNYFWREQRMQAQFRRAVLDGAIFGRGILKTGYAFEVDSSSTPAKDGALNYDDFLRVDNPYIRRVDPRYFYLDPQARDRDLATARWVAEDFFVARGDLEVNSRYDEGLRRKIKLGRVPVTTAAEYAVEVGLGREQYDALSEDIEQVDDPVLLTEVWDKKYRKFFIFLYGGEEHGPLFEADWPYDYLDGFPYVFYSFSEEPGEESGVGIPLLLEDQQLELNRIRTSQYNQRRRFAARKYVTRREAFDPEELSKLKSGTDGEIVVANQPNPIDLLEQGQPPADNALVESTIKDDMQKIIGADQLLQGGMLPSRTTAAEVRARQSIVGLKVDALMQLVDEFLHEVATQVMQHIEANFADPRVIRALSEDGQETLERVTAEDVRAELDLEVTSTTKERDDPQMERQQALMLLNNILAALPALQAVGSQLSPDAIFRWAMSKFPDVELHALFGPPLPPPLAPAGTGSRSAAAGAGPAPGGEAQAASAGPESMAMAAMMGGLSGAA